MREDRRAWWLAGLLIAGCVAYGLSSELRAAGGRQYPPRGPATPQKTPAQQQPQAPAAEVQIPGPKETTLGDDAEQNIKALQQEKLDLIRHRVTLLNQAFAAGQITQAQLDQATVEQLHQELEVIDRPQLRIMALEQLVTILRRFEDDAKTNLAEAATGKKSNDVSRSANAHGRYVNARLRRLDVQIRLEKEKLELKNATAKASGETKQ